MWPSTRSCSTFSYSLGTCETLWFNETGRKMIFKKQITAWNEKSGLISDLCLRVTCIVRAKCQTGWDLFVRLSLTSLVTQACSKTPASSISQQPHNHSAYEQIVTRMKDFIRKLNVMTLEILVRERCVISCLWSYTSLFKQTNVTVLANRIVFRGRHHPKMLKCVEF